MKTYQDYKLMVDRINEAACMLAEIFPNVNRMALMDDLCANSENIHDANTFNFNSSEQDWSSMVYIAELTFGQRLEDYDIKARDYGFDY